MRILVTGREGQVARSLHERGVAKGHDVTLLGRPSLDLASDPAKIMDAVLKAKPDVVISAAAYTSVDDAENDYETAWGINVRGAEALANASKELGVPLLHLSTDYVFDGTKQSPYVETDLTAPASVYGETKRDGEDAVLTTYVNAAILRTAWVYSPFGNNFVKTMLRLGGEREEINVVSDQRGNPTSALDIADGLMIIAENLMRSKDPALRGIFHMAGAGSTSWAEFAQAIFEESAALGGPSPRVRPIATKDYPTAARRPANSMLDCSKLETAHGVRLPHWKASMAVTVKRLAAEAASHKEQLRS